MTNGRLETYADHVLDRGFLEELGRFVANCGHLEKVLWILFARIARLDVEDDVDAVRALRVSRKPFGARPSFAASRRVRIHAHHSDHATHATRCA